MSGQKVGKWEGVSRSRPRLTISFWTGGQDEISIRLRAIFSWRYWDLAPSCSVKALNFELTLQARKTQAAFSVRTGSSERGPCILELAQT